MTRPPTLDELALTGAIDARLVVPVTDEHGGVTIYYGGRPAQYLMNGEWFVARPVPTMTEAFDDVAPRSALSPWPAVDS